MPIAMRYLWGSSHSFKWVDLCVCLIIVVVVEKEEKHHTADEFYAISLWGLESNVQSQRSWNGHCAQFD